MKSERIEWIDFYKGLGILAVVVGHIWQAASQYLFWFHMPLFFFISGYLYKPTQPVRQFFAKKTLQLLAPYASFLLMFCLLKYASMWLEGNSFSSRDTLVFMAKLLYGGRYLVEWFGVFWFVSCLFFTQQLYNALYRAIGWHKLLWLVILSMYLLALLNSFYLATVPFPWNINVVLMAIVYYHLGHASARLAISPTLKILLSMLVVASAIGAQMTGYAKLALDMKYTVYGVPIYSVAVALGCIFLVQALAQALATTSLPQRGLSELGQASMTIMFMHQAIQMSLAQWPPLAHPLPRIVFALLVPLAFYKLFALWPLTQKLFLGNWNNASSPLSK